MVGNQWSTMSNNWSSMGNQWSMMGSMGNNWSMMDWFSNIWDGLTLVPDISNEAIVMVSVVGDNLDTTIRKFNSVLS